MTKKEKFIEAIRNKKITDDKSALKFVLKEKEKEELIKEILPQVKGEQGPKGEKGGTGPKGEIGKSGEDGKDGKTPDTDQIITTATQKAIEAIKPTIPKIEDIESELPQLGKEIRDGLELLIKDERLDISAIKGLDDYGEISRLARQPRGIGGGSIARNFYQLFDTPENYSGQSGKVLSVKSDETGLEFTTAGGGLWSRSDTTITPATAGDDVSIGSGDLSMSGGDFTMTGGSQILNGISVEYYDPTGVNYWGAFYYDGTDVFALENSSSVAAFLNLGSLTDHRTFTFPNITGTLVTTNGALADIDIGAYDFTIDTDVFFVDAANDYIGMGTVATNIENQLHILMTGDKDILIDGSTNPRTINTGVMRFEQKPNIDSTRCITMNIDNNSKNDTHGYVINFNATGLTTVASMYNVNLNTVNASAGSIVRGYEISRAGAGTVEVQALHINPGVEVIHQDSGSFSIIEKAWDEDGGFTDITTALGSTSTDVTLFDALNDRLYIGMAATFNVVEVNLATNASNPGIKPTFEVSNGSGGWIPFFPVDKTIGFRQTGIIEWETNPAGWSVDTVNGVGSKYWFRITRTKTGSLTTDPIEDTIKVQTATEYLWDKDGDLTIRDISIRNLTATGTGTFGTLSLRSNNELRFYDNGNYVGFEAPALAADKIWVLPNADGNADDALTTDGSGNLSWAAAAGGQTLYETIVDAAGGGDYTLLSTALAAGKTSIFIRNGTYIETADISSALSDVQITGESKEKTIIDFDYPRQLDTTGGSWVIRNLTIKGGNGNGAIRLRSAGFNQILDCIFENNTVDLVLGCGQNLISRCEFKSVNGLKMINGSNNRVVECNFNGGGFTIDINSHFNSMVGCHYDGGDASISGDGNIIVGNIFGRASRGGIVLLGDRNVVMGNTFVRGQVGVNAIHITSNNNIVSGNAIEGISVAYDDNIALLSTANNNIISNNYIAGAAAYGIHIEAATETENIIIGNQFSGNTTADINDLGTGTTIQNNYPVDIVSGEKRFIQMKNTSGGQLVQGDIVTLKAVAAGNEITTTTAQGDDLIFGMIDETIADAATGRVQILGKTTKLKVDGTTDIAIGDFIGCFTTAKIGMKAAAGDMAIAIALEAYATNDSAGVIDALLISPRKI